MRAISIPPKLAARWCNKCTSFIWFNPSPAEGCDNEHQSHIFPSKPQNFRFHLCIPEHRGKAPAQPGGVPEDQSSRHHSLTSAVHSSSKNAPADKQSVGPKSLLLGVSPSVGPPLAPSRPLRAQKQPAPASCGNRLQMQILA